MKKVHALLLLLLLLLVILIVKLCDTAFELYA